MLNLSKRRLGYQPALDGVRGIAVIAVIGYHLGYFIGGSAGVTLFFTLSGFLITSLLLEEFAQRDAISLRNFYIRRGLRLLPALFALLAVDVLFILTFRTGWTQKADLASVAVTLLYSSNWVQGWQLLPLNQLAHTWSLSVEEQFYLLWPLLVVLLCRLRLGTLRMAIVIAIAAACSAIARFALMYSGASAMRLYNGTDTRAEALLLGAVAAVAFGAGLLRTPTGSRRSIQWAGTLAFVMLVLYMFAGVGAVPRSTSLAYVGSHTVIALLATILIFSLTSGNGVAGRLENLLTWRPLRFVGQISYGLYLWHVLVTAMLDEAGIGNASWSYALWTVTITLAISLLSYFIIEKPCLRLKHAFASGDEKAFPPILVSAATT